MNFEPLRLLFEVILHRISLPHCVSRFLEYRSLSLLYDNLQALDNKPYIWNSHIGRTILLKYDLEATVTAYPVRYFPQKEPLSIKRDEGKIGIISCREQKTTTQCNDAARIRTSVSTVLYFV
jgi:hypothetical protein